MSYTTAIKKCYPLRILKGQFCRLIISTGKESRITRINCGQTSHPNILYSKLLRPESTRFPGVEKKLLRFPFTTRSLSESLLQRLLTNNILKADS